MKLSLVRNASFGIAVSLVFSLEAQAQLTGLGGLTQGTGGLGGIGGLGGTTGATGGATGFGAAGGAANTKLPGSFGGPGTTGVSIYPKDLTSLNPSTAFSNGSTVSGGAAGGLGGQTGATGTPFGTNAFSTGTTGGLGATGGLGGGLGGGGLGGLGGGRLGGLGGIGGLGGLGGGGAGNTSAQAKKMIRPIVKVDIETERPTSTDRATDAKVRLGRIPLPKKLQGVTSSVVGDVVVLRGQVATESDKRLVERLVKLEPGIDSVRNEVIVQNSSLERIQAKPNR